MRRVVRHGARVVVIDPDGRVLLFRLVDVDEHQPPVIWVTPGGGVEEGEAFAEAARRELREETGIDITLDELGAAVATTSGEWVWRDQTIDDTTHLFAWRVDDMVEIDVAGHTEEEQRFVTGWRWWTADEIDAADEVIYPANLSTLVRALATGHPIDEPLVLPWR